jgi:hypothetical protein
VAFHPEEAYPFLLDLELVKTLSPRVQKLPGSAPVSQALRPWQTNYEDIAGHSASDREADAVARRLHHARS